MADRVEITGRYYVLQDMAAEAAKLSALSRQSPLPVIAGTFLVGVTLTSDREDEARRQAPARKTRTSVFRDCLEGGQEGSLHRQPAAPRELDLSFGRSATTHHRRTSYTL